VSDTKPWFEFAPDLDQKPGDPEALAIHWLTYAAAHDRAYAEARRVSPEEAGRASHTYLYPYIAGFTAAALAKGRSPEWIHRALEDGATAAEFTWQWLHEAGIDPDRIRSASDLVPMVDRGIARRAAASEADSPVITHQSPPDGTGTFPCCGRTPFEVSPMERMTTDPGLVTCLATRPMADPA
jgi:hypothetical protein